MNKPEPLKGKLREGICPNTFNFYDVRSAVEWLREQYINGSFSRNDVMKLIDEAFADVKNQAESELIG